MNFKLDVILKPLFITIREPVTLEFGNKQNASVTVAVLNAEQRQRYKPNALQCTSLIETDIAPDIQEIFERLASNLMPKGFKPSQQHQDLKHIDVDGRITEGHGVSLDLFPQRFQEFSSLIHHQLSEAIKQAVKIIRWRLGCDSLHNPIAFTNGVSWSFDNMSWHRAPHDIHAEIEGRVSPRISGKPKTDIETLIQSDQSEPLGHELFLEAWELRRTNPRSALIIGMSAAEIGLKQCIGKLVPDAEWLAIHVQTPPLVEMLSKYLPELPAKLTIEGRVLKPVKSMMKTLDEGVKARNRSAHQGSEPPNRGQLKKLLLCVRDLLYLLDFYCGHEWAIEQIRDEIRQEMVNEFKLKTTRPHSLIELG